MSTLDAIRGRVALARDLSEGWTSHGAEWDRAALLAAVDAVLAKHKPAGIYGECECDDETLDSPDHEPIGLMDMEACSNSFQFWACRECCFVNDYNTEECATYHVHTADKSQPCCPTVKAITEALGGTE